MDPFAFEVCNFADPSRGRKGNPWKYEFLIDGSTGSVDVCSRMVDLCHVEAFPQ